MNLITMMGISCSSKSTRAKLLKEKYNAVLLSSDTLRQELHLHYMDEKVFKHINEIARKYINQNKSVIIDSTNLTAKTHARCKSLINKDIDCKFICYYTITHPYKWIYNAKARIEGRWKGYETMNSMFLIRNKHFENLKFPLPGVFDNIILDITDINLKQKHIKKFKRYYNSNIDLFLKNPRKFFNNIYEDGLLKKVIPELYLCYNYNQKNKHHTLTLENHIFTVAENLKVKTIENMWVAILHDIGKALYKLRKKKPDGEYSYHGHAGASTEMAICILKRLGFNDEFIKKVALIISYHMYLPYDEPLNKKKQKLIGQDLLNKLTDFREVDLIAK